MKIRLIIGPPGSGKSTEIKNFVLNNEKSIVIGFSWMLCSLIGGRTFYNVFGINPNMTVLDDAKKMLISRLNIRYLLVDEVFMFNSNEFNMLIECAKCLPELKEIICYGDFMQLKSYDGLFYEKIGLDKIEIEYRTKIYRSIGCPRLTNLIELYRNSGKLDLSIFKDKIISSENTLIKDYVLSGGIICCGTNERIRFWTSKLYNFKGFQKLPDNRLYLGKAYMDESYDILVKGLIVNIERFDKTKVWITLPGNREALCIPGKWQKYNWHFPFSPLIATTVHKLQGQTLDKIIIDISDLFEFNSVYTAISRVKKIDDIIIFCPKDKLSILDRPIETSVMIWKTFRENKDNTADNQ